MHTWRPSRQCGAFTKGAVAVALVIAGFVPAVVADEVAAVGFADLTVDPALPAPSGVCATGTTGTAHITWDLTTDPAVTGHVVQYRLADADTWTDGPNVTAPTTVDISVVDSVRYEYRVAALSAAGERSDWGQYCLMGGGDVFGDGFAPVGQGGVLDGAGTASLTVGGSRSENGGHACATDAAGLVACWGANLVGSLGDGTFLTRAAPTRTIDAPTLPLVDVVAVTAGRGHSCALTAAGKVACWGLDNYGQLGFDVPADGAPVKRASTPGQVTDGAMAGAVVTSIAAGDFATCATTAAGGAVCWGLGYGIAPVAVSGGALDGATLTSVAVGESFACGLTSTKRVVCWNADRLTPPADRTEGALTGKAVVRISANGPSVCAIAEDGRGACWSGTTGFPTSVMSGVLAGQVLADLQVSHGVSGQQTCARTTSHEVACWNTLTPANDLSWLSGPTLHGVGLTTIAVGPESMMGRWNGVFRTGPPPQPVSITSVEAVQRVITIAWVAPTDLGLATLTGYRIEQSSNGGYTWSLAAEPGLVTTAPVTVPYDGQWRFRIAALSTAGQSAWAYSSELEIIVDSRSTKSNVTVTFATPDGRPVVGSSISWKTSDGVLAGVTPVITSATGAAVFPVLATGAVVFTATGGTVASTPVRLANATFRRIVAKGLASFVIVTPDLPATIARTITVEMPDGSRVPDTALTISGGITGTTSTGGGGNAASWSVLGWSDHPSSGPTGQTTLVGFPRSSVGADVTAIFSDGFIQQTANASLVDASITIVFEQMPVVQMTTSSTDPLDPGASATITVTAIDGDGTPLVDAPLSLSTTAARVLPHPDATAACTAKLVGTTNVNGQLTFTVCPTVSANWRADGVNIVPSEPVAVKVKPSPTVITSGANHTCARLADGTARCWGSNSNGQLGNGTLAGAALPAAVTGVTNASQISAGGSHTCAIVGANGSVRCWGLNSTGQLGDGTTTRRTTAVSVKASGTTLLTGVSRIATGSNFTCAVLSPGPNGTARCWGANASGQLGNGTVTTQLRPSTLRSAGTTALVGVTRIATGNAFACALLHNGAVRCWGLNNYGQLGNGATNSNRYPVGVTGIDGIKAKATAIAAGDGFACARLTDGTIRCWGRNDLGQLGNGATTGSRVPVAVRTAPTTPLTGATVLSAGSSHSCVITGTGSAARVRCWGNNTSGQLGNGTSTTSRYAVMATGLGGATAISAGGLHTAALFPSAKRPPSLAATWGRNASGQLGDGTLAGRTTPASLTKL